MQSNFNILSALYRIINTPEVLAELSGKVYIGEPPYTGQDEVIAINLITNPNRYIQSGYGNLNIHVPNLAEGRNDLQRLSDLVDLVIPLMNGSRITTEKGTFYFQVEDQKGVFKDEDRDGMSYYNIKFEYQTT
jgi:hypothetical protein